MGNFFTTPAVGAGANQPSSRIQLSATSGLTLYTFFLSPLSGLPSSGAWAGQALSLTETIPNSGEYFGSVPLNSRDGLYLLPIFVQSGDTPASTDLQLGVSNNQPATNDVPPPIPNHPITLAIDWCLESGIRSVSRLGAAPGAPRPEVLPQPQYSVLTAQRIVSELYKAREEIAAGGSFASVTIDGQSFTYSSASQIDQSILFWERKVARLTGRRRRVTAMRLDRF